MPSTKELKQRIKGIKSTGKITRAMEMISAVKMRKAVAKAMAIRPYAQASLQVLSTLSQAMKMEESLFFREREVKRVLIVVMTSHRGLCGSFNAQVIRKVKQEMIELHEKYSSLEKVDFVSVGKKGDSMLRALNGTIMASFPDLALSVSSTALRPLVKGVRDEYESGKYDKVMLVYTDSVSPLVQKVKIRRLLPLSQGALQDEMNEMAHSKKMMYEEVGVRANTRIHPNENTQFTIEPDPETVLTALVPRLIEIQLHHALLESNASQEAARMMAMRNATDAAKDIVADFTLSYNQLRQAKVTQEIAELSAGMAAVSG
jgi:F-type H+-transporting ATPase subunit gamma